MASVTQLGYLVFEVSDLRAWEAFATGVLGLVVAGRDEDGTLRLRNDGHAQRIVLRPGEADDLAVLGWQVGDAAAAETLVERLREAGVAVERGSEADARDRRVQGLYRFSDPGGVPSELAWGPERAAEPFASPQVASGFVADEMGLGHIVISARDKDENLRFYTELLGFRLSDHITCELYGYHVDIAFMHANRRHHSVAFGGRQRKRLHHFMLEVGSMDDVGLAWDRALRAGVKIAQTLGRHPNDRMFSFYAHTPSGFQFELGWGGREVDDATWQPTVHTCVSEWGHHPPQLLAPRKPRPE